MRWRKQLQRHIENSNKAEPANIDEKDRRKETIVRAVQPLHPDSGHAQCAPHTKGLKISISQGTLQMSGYLASLLIQVFQLIALHQDASR
jgi:hypothetical protein